MKNFKFKTSIDPAGLAHYLNTLAEAVVSGQLLIRGSDNELCLHPSGLVDLEVKVRRKKYRGFMMLEMSWTEADLGNLPLSSSCKDL